MSAPAPTTARPEQQDEHRWRRLVLVLAVTQTVGYGALIQSFTVLLVPIADDLGVSRSAVTLAATISTLVGAAAALPVGSLLDRYGGRTLMTTGSAVGVVAVLLWSRAGSLTGLYLAFTLVGLALAMSTYEAAFAVLVVATEHRHRDGAIVVLTMITGLATSFYYPLTGWLDGLLGWRTALLVLAGTLALVAVPVHLWAVPGRAAHSLRATARSGAPVGGALRSPRFWLLLVAFVAQAGATSAFLLLMVTYFRDVGFSPATASALPLAVGTMQIGSRLALAPLARRFGMATVTAVSFAVQGASLLVLPLAGTSLPLTLACVGGFGLGYGISVVARPSIVADTFGVARFASILAVMTVPMALSRAGAPLVGAWIADERFVLVMGAASLVAAAALVPLARSTPVVQPAVAVSSAEASSGGVPFRRWSPSWRSR
ncbi:MFS transporter [Cellulomonas chitinilytica]|uniref:MFS transporter n=1 Tax=Cellulomonas chitinilytica TaxID=398759 RepID=A0A919P1S1_9CELL|nr:MFS transporter [Cellulomonas chitinilytica]GIG19544.1 MFS transporter [Cellulomonas chitinilytica]